MELLTPSLGLVFWQTVIFLIVFYLLRKFAWKPILGALKTREFQIEDALRAAEAAQEEMEQIKMDNEYLLYEARMEKDQLLKEATLVANKIKEDAKNETAKIADKMIADAKTTIETEKKNALLEVRKWVSELSIDIAEKLIKEKLKEDAAQKKLVQKYLDEAQIN